MIKLFISQVLLASILFASTLELTKDEKAYIKNNKFNVCTRVNHFPLSAEKDGEIIGIGGEIFKMLSTLSKIQYKVIASKDNEELYENINSNLCDLVVTLKHNQTKFKNLDTIDPIFSTSWVSIGNSNSPFLDHFTDFSKHIFYVKEPFHKSLVLNKYPNLNIKIDKDIDSVMKLIEKNDNIHFLNISITADYQTQQYGANKFKINGIFDKLKIDSSIGVNKKHPLLLSTLNKSLSQLDKNEIYSIVTKYRIKEYKIEKNYNGILVSILILTLIGILILLIKLNRVQKIYTKALEKKIKNKTISLQNQNMKLDMATKSANLGIWSWNFQDNELSWDDNMYSIYDVEDKQSVAYDNWINALHPGDKERALHEIQYAIENNKNFDTIFRIITLKNNMKFIKATGIIYFENDKPSKMIGTNNDITKTFELQNELKETHDKLSGLFNLSPIGIVLNSMDGKFIEVNKSFERMTGYTKEELNELDYWALTPIKYQENEHKQLKSLKENGIYGPYEKEYIQKNGNTVPINLNGMLIEIKNTKYIWSLIEDISQRKAHEKVLLEQKTLEEEKNLIEQSKMVAMGEMMSNISHQWKQPLATIKTINMKLKVSHELNMLNDESLMKSLSKQNEQIQYLSNVISTFNDYLSPNSFKIQKIQIQTIIDNSLSIVSATLRYKYIKVINNANNVEPIIIETIPNELNEVLINILNNAKDILTEKVPSSKREIIIDLHNIEDKIQITIEDNAGGIPENIIHNIFEPYFTTKHKSQGTGLGLHICYTIIVKHLGGNIYVKNTNQGAKFFIELPLIYEGEK